MTNNRTTDIPYYRRAALPQYRRTVLPTYHTTARRITDVPCYCTTAVSSVRLTNKPTYRRKSSRFRTCRSAIVRLSILSTICIHNMGIHHRLSMKPCGFRRLATLIQDHHPRPNHVHSVFPLVHWSGLLTRALHNNAPMCQRLLLDAQEILNLDKSLGSGRQQRPAPPPAPVRHRHQEPAPAPAPPPASSVPGHPLPPPPHDPYAAAAPFIGWVLAIIWDISSLVASVSYTRCR
ncbi:hypothetical protein PISMIDRAFT_279221 [Pisolithus microcarpus 441]|uniref:Uncharacterized protein n=1 Tax=Pisolithus microcarpus 441 TaxID=765257 RepID=A0A0C9Z876_9AGAM|nr:hypothetical protein PISMIDRAFT_279221 [Pisolithus microcarpus 441]